MFRQIDISILSDEQASCASGKAYGFLFLAEKEENNRLMAGIFSDDDYSMHLVDGRRVLIENCENIKAI